MRIRLIWVGRTKNEHVRALVDDYLQRLGRFVRCEVTELRESAGGGSGNEQGIVEEESKRIALALARADGALTVLLDVEGRREWSSTELAAQVERWQLEGKKEIAFVIGGHLGVAAELKAKADVRWSLSRLTLTHEMARVVLVEQLYRAYTIMHGLPYQK
ncbi:MAG TPA: 23S rRNA (pseudouridine(1915)-N(3))-methyltransferase RlmH [Pyrinomonadaceae bacterium]|jgi:23S rRNA (pseudouridine1915-N3)-methyltransferase|nr:23S rRNA (pseudouridine(1915)-N(3))-methyltransferase RlmH [Pyrinomonadaceae bacterium]